MNPKAYLHEEEDDPEFVTNYLFINTKLDYSKKVNINNGLDGF